MGGGAVTTRDGIDGEGGNGARKRTAPVVPNEGKRPRVLEHEISAATPGHELSQFGGNLSLRGQSKHHAEGGEPFDRQLILELGEVPGIADAIRTLELQHPDKPTVWFRLDEHGYPLPRVVRAKWLRTFP